MSTYFELINADILHLILLKLKSNDFNNFVTYGNDNEISINYRYLLYSKYKDIAIEINTILSIDKRLKMYKDIAWKILYIDLLPLSDDGKLNSKYFLENINDKSFHNDQSFRNEFNIRKFEKYNSITIIILNCIYLHRNWPMMYEKRYYFKENPYSIILYNSILAHIQYIMNHYYIQNFSDFYSKYLSIGKINDDTFVYSEIILEGDINSSYLIRLYLIAHEPNFHTFGLDSKIIEWIENSNIVDSHRGELLADIKEKFVYEILDKYDIRLDYIRYYVVEKYLDM
jgi:hypothetical protein